MPYARPDPQIRQDDRRPVAPDQVAESDLRARRGIHPPDTPAHPATHQDPQTRYRDPPPTAPPQLDSRIRCRVRLDRAPAAYRPRPPDPRLRLGDPSPTRAREPYSPARLRIRCPEVLIHLAARFSMPPGLLSRHGVLSQVGRWARCGSRAPGRGDRFAALRVGPVLRIPGPSSWLGARFSSRFVEGWLLALVGRASRFPC